MVEEKNNRSPCVFPADFCNWQDAMASFTPENNFFTKEDFEVYSSWLDSQRAVFDSNEALYKKFQSQNLTYWCKREVVFDIKKIGAPLLNRKKQDYDVLSKIMDNWKEITMNQVNAMASISSSFSSNPIVDVKQLVIAGILEVQVLVSLSNMSHAEDNIITTVNQNTWCPECCSIVGKKAESEFNNEVK